MTLGIGFQLIVWQGIMDEYAQQCSTKNTRERDE
jgi:hypothetical protein